MLMLTTDTSPPWVIAHRGFSARYPENTRAAFTAAVAEDIAGMELDLQFSSDGVPVVYHDQSLEKLGMADKRIQDLPFEQLRQLDMGSWFDRRFFRERILTLEEVLIAYAGMTTLLLEVKRGHSFERTCELACHTADVVQELAMQDSVFILCFDLQALLHAQTYAPDLRYVLNVDKPPEAFHACVLAWEKLSAISVARDVLTPRLAMDVRHLGKPLMVYTCNMDAQLRLARDCKANAIMSDDPAWLAEGMQGMA